MSSSSPAGPVVEVLPSPLAAAHRLADHLTEIITLAINDRGRAVVAVSGGSSPVAAFEALGHRTLPWEQVHLLQVDEREAPFGHPDRNLTAQAAAFPHARWHPLPVGDDPADLHELSFEPRDEPRAMVELLDHLDAVHLGLGDDGHTASWPPGYDVPDDVPYVSVGEFNGWRRQTLTPHVVNGSRSILWLITGVGKRLMLERLLSGDPTIPAGLVRLDPTVTVITDQSVSS